MRWNCWHKEQQAKLESFTSETAIKPSPAAHLSGSCLVFMIFRGLPTSVALCLLLQKASTVEDFKAQECQIVPYLLQE